MRASGRGMVASALGEATPVAVTGAGVVTVSVSDGTLSQAIESGSEVILAALHKRFAGVTRLATRVANEARATGTTGTKRLTADDVIATRVSMLRKRDPLLDAAVDALDLRLID